MRIRTFQCILVGVVTLFGSHAAQANGDEIKLGMSAPFTGPASKLGEEMRAGIEIAFDEANKSGGVNGRKVRLVALDDGYEPQQAAANTRKLIDDEKVLALIGSVGTPTAVAALPIATARKALFYGAYTGANILRTTPPERYVINFRASYAEETAQMVDALVTKARMSPEEIAFFTQRDAYGDAGYNGGLAALKRHGLKDEHSVAHGRYDRNTLAVENGLADLLSSEKPPKAVIMVGAYAPCAKFVQLARTTGLDSLFLSVSFVGSASLKDAAGSAGEGIIITQVVPAPESNLPLCESFRKAREEFKPDVGLTFGTLEGYAAAAIMLKAMRSAGEKLDRETVIDAFHAMGDFDAGLGSKLHLSKTQTQASHAVWTTVIRGGKIVPATWDELLAPPAATPSPAKEHVPEVTTVPGGPA